jgi:peptidoglycan/LPS O-acetylase OafA/YrhL
MTDLEATSKSTVNLERDIAQSPLGRRAAAWRTWAKHFLGGTTVQGALARREDNFLLLRIVAAAMVIYGHAPHIAPAVSGTDVFVRMGWGIYSGDIAVDAFFLISGFLVTGSYIRQRSLYRFAKARFLRVYPAFVLNVVGLALVYGLLFTSLSAGNYLRQADVWHYITINLRMSSTMAWTLPGVLEEGLKTTTVNGSQWTLPSEVRMYVMLGALGAVGLFASVRTATITLAGILVAGALWWTHFHSHGDWLRLGSYFLLGSLVYTHRASIRISPALVAGLVLLAVLTRHVPIYPAMFALALAGMVFGLAYLTPPWHWLDRFGDPSYGIYLWGWPCQQAVAKFLPRADWGLHVVLALVMAVALGYASWGLVEKRMLRFK